MSLKIIFASITTGLFLFSLPAYPETGSRKTLLTISGDEFIINGETTKLWGVRLASATISEENTKEFLRYLSDYKAHGINCISVFLMGSSGGAEDPFSADGKVIEPAHLARAGKIIGEMDRLNMICVLGIFYQNVGVYGGTKKLGGWDESVEAVRTVVEWIKKEGYTNVILNIANEQNSSGYDDDPWARVKNVNDICSLCSMAKKIYPSLIVGAGGYNEGKNKQISVCPDVEVLLYDTTDPVEGDYYTDKTLYDSYRDNFIQLKVSPKPLFNVEQFGAYSRRFEPPQGNYEKFPDGKTYYYRCIDIAFDNPGLNTSFHSNVWYQGDRQNYSNRFDLGGNGSAADPGVHWYFDYLQQKLRNK